MIKKIFKLTGFILLSVISLTSCKDDDNTGNDTGDKVSVIELNNNTGTISNFINFESVPTYKANFKPAEGIMYTTPSNNLTLTINPNSIMKKDGGNVPEELTIMVREYLNIGDMLIGGVSTTSDNKMLVTGGNFYWQIEDKNGNTDYVIKGNNNTQVKMNVLTNLNEEYLSKMEYYQGTETKKDNISVINWVTPKEGFEFWMQGPGEGNQSGNYNTFFIYGLDTGWTNCDYLSDYIKEKGATQFKVKLKAKESYNIKATKLIMVSKTFPSVVKITTFDNNYYKTYENSIPKGLDATLIAIGENEKGEVFLTNLDIKVNGDDVYEMMLKPSTKEQIKDYLKKFK